MMKKAMDSSEKTIKFIVAALIVCELLFVYFYFLKPECLWDKNPKHFTYVESETYDGIAITGYTGNRKNVSFPSAIDGQEVVEIGDFAFDSNYVIENVKIPDGIKRIGMASFRRCLNLRTVEMADSVEVVDYLAFYNSWLEEVKLSSGLEEIGVGAFCDTHLKSVDIPSSVKTIKAGAFKDNALLEELTLPNSVERIEMWAFYGVGIWELTLPENLQEVGDLAFARNLHLGTLVIESKSLKCGDRVFEETRISEAPESKYEVQWGEDCFD